MKTAMQELIDDLKELKKDSKERNQDSSFDIGMTFAIARAELRLEKEKEQIKDAFGTKKIEYIFNKLKGYESHSQTSYLISGEEYYNQTYNN